MTIPHHPSIYWKQVPLSSSFCQRSNPLADARTSAFYLSVHNKLITRSIVDSMIELLNFPSSDTGDEEFPWIEVILWSCRFPVPDNTSHTGDYAEYCTPDEKLRLFSAIALRASHVSISSSPSIVSSFLNICHQVDFKVKHFIIEQGPALSALECSQLGQMLPRSVELKWLRLGLPRLDGVHELFEGIAGCTGLRELWLTQTYPVDLLVGVNGPLVRLLRNPQNQLKTLSLVSMDVQDHHLSAILQLIPTSKIDNLDFRRNAIQLPGILEFARLLPKMHSLKYVDFRENSWSQDLSREHRQTVGVALLQAMKQNTSMEGMGGFEYFPHYTVLSLHMALNRFLRRILLSSRPIPDGLWPIILAWAGTSRYLGLLFDKRSLGVNVVFLLLQNCPRIFSFCS